MTHSNTVYRIRNSTVSVLATAALALLCLPGYAQNAADPGANTDATKAKSAQVQPQDDVDPNQAIKTDFVLNVSVAGEPDASGNYPVDSAGNITIKYAGQTAPVAVKGLTPAQAADAVRKYLTKYIRQPDVTVTIASVPRRVVFVGGAVRNAGPIIVTPDTTLVDVMSHAEWLDNADLAHVRITHRSNDPRDVPKVDSIDFGLYIKAGAGQSVDEKLNPLLRDRDRVFVPFKNIPSPGTISVTGDVATPKEGIALNPNAPMTVREAINLAGGANQTANRKAISIRRAGLDKPLFIDLDKAEQGDLVNNVELKPDDSVYVEKLEKDDYVNIDGGVAKPGKLVYDRRITLTQAIMESGGIAPGAKTKDCVIFRHPDSDPAHSQTIPFNWTDVEKGKAKDIELHPGDSVWITPGNPNRVRGIDMIFGALRALGTGAYLLNTIRGRGF